MQNQYIPGACNIGIDEIEKRKQIGWAGLIGTIILFGLFVYLKVPQVWRLAVLCLLSLYDFGEIGKTDIMEQAEFRAKNRKKAWQIIIYSIIVGVIVSALAYILPV